MHHNGVRNTGIIDWRCNVVAATPIPARLPALRKRAVRWAWSVYMAKTPRWPTRYLGPRVIARSIGMLTVGNRLEPTN